MDCGASARHSLLELGFLPGLTKAVRPREAGVLAWTAPGRSLNLVRVVQRLRSGVLLTAACLLLVACGGSSDDAREALRVGPSSDITETVEALVGAALSGDADRFSRYLASSCREQGNVAAAAGALRDLLPAGQVDVQIPRMEVDTVDQSHVTVTVLPGLQVLVDGKPLSESVAVGIVGLELDLVWEVGAWRLESCEAVAS